MPKVPKRRFQCHFPPLSNRSIFRGEALLTGIPLATRTAFSFEEEPAPQRSLPSAGDRSSRKLIPKPPGEVSRLSRGGYNLGETLGWSKEDYGAVRNGLRDLAKTHLDMTIILSEQDESKLRTVLRVANERFPILKDYEGDWVSEDFLSTMLKNSADRHKRQTPNTGSAHVSVASANVKEKREHVKWKDRVRFTTTHSAARASPGCSEEDEDEEDEIQSEDD